MENGSAEHAKPLGVAVSKYEPTERERAVLAKQALRLEGQPVAPRLKIVSDYRGSRVEYDHPDPVTAFALLKEEAFGTADNDFASGMLGQLYGFVQIEDMSDSGSGNESELNLLVSILKAGKPVDELHAMLLANAAVCHLAGTRLLQKLSEPMKYDMPDELKIAMAYRNNVQELPTRRIRIDNQSMLEFCERAATRLMETSAQLLQAANRYRMNFEWLMHMQQVSVAKGDRAVRKRAPKNAIVASLRKLNGSRQFKPPRGTNSTAMQKSNGRAST